MYFQNCEILDINRIEDKFLKEILDVYSYVIENSQKIELELKLVKDFEVEFRKYSPKDLKLRPSTEKLILNLTNVLPVYNSSKLLCLINEKYFNYLKGININPVMSIELDLIKYVTRLNLVNKIVIESNTLPKVFTESFVKGLVNALIDLLIESCYVKELENTYNIKYIVEPISIMYNNMIIANVKLKDDMIIRAYRDFYWRYLNIDPTKIRPSGEALARRVLQGKDIPRINNLVDAYNLASLKNIIPLSGFDLDLITPPLEIRFSKSNELFKGILDDHANAVFKGHILVRKDAQKTNAFQTNRNVLLTDKATVNTKPFLEIYADDVKCSHGATVGQLDDEALFYIKSRGISEYNAKLLLMYAFAAEIINKITLEPLKDRMDDLVKKRLRGELAVCSQCVLHCKNQENEYEFEIDMSKL